MIGLHTGSLARADDPGFHVAHLDEDEATLAVAAARTMLASQKLEQIQRIEFVAEQAPWAEHVRLALGLRHASLAFVDERDPHAEGLRITSDAGRGKKPRPAIAQARIAGATATARAEPQPARRLVDAEFLKRLRDAEERALTHVAMGAFVSRQTWDASLEARYRLLVSTCTLCNQSSHPPYTKCPRCGNPTQVRPHAQGTIHTFTVIAKGGGPTEFDEWQAVDGDYVVAIVDLQKGVRVAGMLTSVDPATIRIGQPVRAVFRRLYAQDGVWRYGTKFQPVPE